MKQTALAQAIEKIEKHCDNYVLHKKDVIDILLSLKPMERQQIENAYWDGGQDIPCVDASCKEYFDNHLTQD